jgi:hypothetical protein
LFVEALKRRAEENTPLAEQVAELLNVSTDSAYRRLRGATLISLDEAAKLGKHFNINLSEAIEDDSSGSVLFHTNKTYGAVSLDLYIERIAAHLEAFSKEENSRFIMAARDLPTFYYGFYPKLADFKLYFWHKSILAETGQELEHYENYIPRQSIKKGMAAISKLHQKLNTSELWNIEILSSTIRQLNYYNELGYFSTQESVQEIKQELLDLLLTCEKDAEQGFRIDAEGNKAPYNLYHQEYMVLDDTILAVSDSNKAVFINYNGLFYLKTLQNDFCAEIENWTNEQMKKASLISGSAEKERKLFFNQLRKQLDLIG